MTYITDVSGGVFQFNAEMFSYDWMPNGNPITALLLNSTLKDQIYEALHINHSYKQPIFEYSSKNASAALSADLIVDYSKYYDYLITANFPLLLSAGEVDMLDGAKGQQAWL